MPPNGARSPREIGDREAVLGRFDLIGGEAVRLKPIEQRPRVGFRQAGPLERPAASLGPAWSLRQRHARSSLCVSTDPRGGCRDGGRSARQAGAHPVPGRRLDPATSVSSVFRKQLRELRSPTQTIYFRRGDGHASENDRRKWRRDTEPGSKWIERKRRPNDETRHATVRRRDEFVLSHSRF